MNVTDRGHAVTNTGMILPDDSVLVEKSALMPFQ
jgi:hypothetical protein